MGVLEGIDDSTKKPQQNGLRSNKIYTSRKYDPLAIV